jgi:phage terminase large subunit GpA-like protein
MGKEVWDELTEYLDQTYLHESGAQLPISSACLDTGGTAGYTQAAYDYAKGKTGRRLFAIKGGGTWGSPVVASPSRKKSGKNARKVDLFIVGVDEAKLVVMRRLAQVVHGPGYCHFPTNREEDYFKQLTAEQLKTRFVKGFPVREWHQMRPRNEALDCRVYAYAALKILNPAFKRLAARLKVTGPVETVDEWAKKAAERAESVRKALEKVREATKKAEKEAKQAEKPSEKRVENPPEEPNPPVVETAKVRQAKRPAARKRNFATTW